MNSEDKLLESLRKNAALIPEEIRQRRAIVNERMRFNTNPTNFSEVQFKDYREDNQSLGIACLRIDPFDNSDDPIVKEAIVYFKGAYILLRDNGWNKSVPRVKFRHNPTYVFGVLDGIKPTIHTLPYSIEAGFITGFPKTEEDHNLKNYLLGDWRGLSKLIEDPLDQDSLEQLARNLDFRPPYSYVIPRVLPGCLLR